jgi:hypothetical protein
VIAKETNTSVRITPPEPHQSCFASDHTVALTITGVPEDTEKCRVRLLVLLDENVSAISANSNPDFSLSLSSFSLLFLPSSFSFLHRHVTLGWIAV